MNISANMDGVTDRQAILFDLVDTWIKAEGVLASSVMHGMNRQYHYVLQEGSLTLHSYRDIRKPGPNGEDFVYDQECCIDYRGDRVFSVASRLVVTGEAGRVLFQRVIDEPGIWEAQVRQRVAEIAKK